MSSLQLTTPLILSGDPTQPRHASTKQYVDMVLGHPNAMGFTSGTIPVAKLPALTGVVSSNAGDNVLTLNNSGVTPGTYTKVTVSSSGRITAGTSTGEDDIQSVDWSRITSGKPTTLAGYGIIDALPSTGGTITGSLKLTQPPSDNLHPVTKAYVDNALLTGDTSLATGDIIRKPTSVTPSGFLRLNGGLVSKTTYADLYAKIGDVFGAPAWMGGGQPWVQQYGINIENDIGLNSASIASAKYKAIPEMVYYAKYFGIFVTKNRVYMVGGQDSGGNAYSTKVYHSAIDSEGNLTGGWVSGPTLPRGLQVATTLVVKDRVFVMGEDANGLAFGFMGDINSDGTVTSWVNGSAPPRTDVSYTLHNASGRNTASHLYNAGKSFVLKNYHYYVPSGSYFIFRGPVTTSEGKPFLGGFTDAYNVGTATTIQDPEVVITKNRVYLFTNNSYFAWVAVINSDGTLGSWSQQHVGFQYNTRTGIYVVNNSVYLHHYQDSNTMPFYKATINSDGTMGGFTLVSSSHFVHHTKNVFATKNSLNFLGGLSYYTFESQTNNAIITIATLGGKNDYSPYYQVMGEPNYNESFFSLPDYSSRETNRLCYYIKT